jgi:hypothetical protein
MLDRRAERHLLRLLSQNNSNSGLIPDEPDGMADDEDIPVLDSWTERTSDDLWVLGDQVEQSTPVDIEFAPWDESMLEIDCGDETCTHGWTDGSRRVSAGFGWTLRQQNHQGKDIELDSNKGCVGEFERAFGGEMEAIADLMEYVTDNEISQSIQIHKQPLHEWDILDQALGKTEQ